MGLISRVSSRTYRMLRLSRQFSKQKMSAATEFAKISDSYAKPRIKKQILPEYMQGDKHLSPGKIRHLKMKEATTTKNPTIQNALGIEDPKKWFTKLKNRKGLPGSKLRHAQLKHDLLKTTENMGSSAGFIPHNIKNIGPWAAQLGNGSPHEIHIPGLANINVNSHNFDQDLKRKELTINSPHKSLAMNPKDEKNKNILNQIPIITKPAISTFSFTRNIIDPKKYMRNK